MLKPQVPKTFRCDVTKIASLTKDVSQIFIRDCLDEPFVAGQYINVQLNETTSISLSVACKPNHKQFLEFHLNHSADNELAQKIYREAIELKKWNINGPYGENTIAKLDLTKSITFIAFGTGFAPIKAIIEELIENSFPNKICFYWMVKSQSDLYFVETLNAWQKKLSGFKFIPIYYLDFTNKDEATKNLVSMILVNNPNFNHQQLYVSGPRPFVYLLFSALTPYGLQRENFHSDVFDG